MAVQWTDEQIDILTRLAYMRNRPEDMRILSRVLNRSMSATVQKLIELNKAGRIPSQYLESPEHIGKVYRDNAEKLNAFLAMHDKAQKILSDKIKELERELEITGAQPKQQIEKMKETIQELEQERKKLPGFKVVQWSWGWGLVKRTEKSE